MTTRRGDRRCDEFPGTITRDGRDGSPARRGKAGGAQWGLAWRHGLTGRSARETKSLLACHERETLARGSRGALRLVKRVGRWRFPFRGNAGRWSFPLTARFSSEPPHPARCARSHRSRSEKATSWPGPSHQITQGVLRRGPLSFQEHVILHRVSPLASRLLDDFAKSREREKWRLTCLRKNS